MTPLQADAQGVLLERVTRVFGAKAALDGVDLEVAPGSFTVLLGPSGSGKTTLLRCVAGIDTPTRGLLSIGGRLVAGDGLRLPPEKRGLAMVFQDYALWPHMDARSNVAFALRRLALSRRQAAARAEDMLELMGLGALARRYPNELSGGEQQRVALARALVAGVGLVLFDEPLSNLDADLREQLRLEIATLLRKSGATALYITHDQGEAFSLADQVVVLRSGQVVQTGSPEDIYRCPVDEGVARFTGIAGELPVVAREAPGDRAVVTLPAWLGGAELSVRAPSMLPGRGPARLLVRPSAVRVVEPGAPAHMSADVVDSAFCGRGYELAIDLPGGARLTRAFSSTAFRPGEPVGVVLDPEGCLVFADGSPGAPSYARPMREEASAGAPL